MKKKILFCILAVFSMFVAATSCSDDKQTEEPQPQREIHYCKCRIVADTYTAPVKVLDEKDIEGGFTPGYQDIVTSKSCKPAESRYYDTYYEANKAEVETFELLGSTVYAECTPQYLESIQQKMLKREVVNF